MKFHIIRTGESLGDILFLYNLTKDELVEENRHIRVWDKLIPGTKIKIPSITEAVEQEVNDMEPFIEDYYPKINTNNFPENELKFPGAEEVTISEEELNINTSDDEIIEEKSEQIKSMEVIDDISPEKKVDANKQKVKTAVYHPTTLGAYNYPRVRPYPYIYYPVYYKKQSR